MSGVKSRKWVYQKPTNLVAAAAAAGSLRTLIIYADDNIRCCNGEFQAECRFLDERLSADSQIHSKRINNYRMPKRKKPGEDGKDGQTIPLPVQIFLWRQSRYGMIFIVPYVMLCYGCLLLMLVGKLVKTRDL